LWTAPDSQKGDTAASGGVKHAVRSKF